MRKIDEQMVDAVLERCNWKSDNTEVQVSASGVVEVRLHGNLIARLTDGEWEYTLAGWNTSTTRSRLSALLRALLPGCCGVGTKKGQANIVYRDGTLVPISSREWFTAVTP